MLLRYVGAALAAIIAAKAAPTQMMIRLSLSVVLMLISHATIALEAVSLKVETIESAGWKLQGIHISLTDLANNTQKLTLTVNTLSLPKPFDDLNLINIHCSSFTWQNKELLCTEGRAQIRSKQWQSPAANFSFHIREKFSTLKLSDLQLAGGIVSVDVVERDNQWQIQINATAVDSTLIQKMFQSANFELKGGRINFKLDASGSHALIGNFSLATELNGLTVQTKDGRFATEALTLDTRLEAQNNEGLWQWQSHSRFKDGALYIEPFYLETGQSMVLDAQGNWNVMNKRAEIKSVSYKHATALALSGSAIIQYDKNVKLEKADLSVQSDDLQKISAIYLKPFFEQTALEGITFAGTINADFSIVQESLTTLTATVNKFVVKDTAERIKVENGVGTINWSNVETFNRPSTFAWQQLQLYALPIGPSRISFLSRANSFKLLEKTHLPFLGGVIAINQLGWQAKKQQDPEIYFAGSLNNVSLEQWSKALNWTPLSGTISGNIPRVEYSNKTLSLGGEINIKVFDGDIKITQLASSGLFTDFPKFSSEMEINNLDLDQLTGKFKFGGITGKLSGFVRQLYMENWQPVTFYAWLGTPDDDDSRHRISQKAVKNIASIGGGGASDILSRSFLSVFETFGYDKIGLGCYLHDGVCQMMGVEARPEGYAIITGGGLPRIEVIGYNPRVDWNVLMERLSRISTSDEAIIK
ncbi:MAG: C4-dicarboxylate ABC transporter [Methylococcaceae bacterium]|nr:C4-dicarboxylate ABC transporter [Methylococcaceae bacterium]